MGPDASFAESPYRKKGRGGKKKRIFPKIKLSGQEIAGRGLRETSGLTQLRILKYHRDSAKETNRCTQNKSD
jgi:hypothetical protein